jgi:hypothetical protein
MRAKRRANGERFRAMSQPIRGCRLARSRTQRDVGSPVIAVAAPGARRPGSGACTGCFASCGQFCTDAGHPRAQGECWGAGQRRVAVNDAQRYRMNAAECLSAAERCEQPYRRLTLAIAETWLLMARQQEAMDELLGNRSEAGSVTSRGIKPVAVRITLPS